MNLRVWLISTLVFLLASCAPANQPAHADRVDLVIRPGSLSEVRWHVPAGDDIQLQVHNQTAEKQVFSLRAPEGAFIIGEPWFSIEVLPGEMIDTVFTAPEAAGEYDVFIEGAQSQARLYAEIVVVQPYSVSSKLTHDNR